MLDLKRTFSLIKGALFDPETTWRSYLPEADNWQKTAFLLTGPLIVLSAVLGYVLGFLGSDASFFGVRPTILSTLLGIVTGAIAAAVIAFIIGRLAGMFGGRSSFARGLAASSLAFVPGYLGQALGWLPWIGTLLALGLFIYSLVLLWRIIPLYLDVPAGKRVGHYILSLVATVVVMFLISLLLRPIIGPDVSGLRDYSNTESSRGTPSGLGGVAGEVMRQGELMAAAEEDRYTPPADGKLDEDQVEDYIRVMRRAGEIMEERDKRLQDLAERAERDEQMSLNDMSEMMAGATQMVGLNTIELEVVKTGGGNWAEHQWVGEALRTAYVQQDINEAVEHNYELYLEHEDELRAFVTR